LVNPDGRPQLSVDRFPSIGRKIARFLFLRRMEQAETTQQDSPMPVDYAISAFWVFRREILSRLGGLDERFFYAPEDVDFCASIWLCGWRVVFVPQAMAIHDARELSRRGVFNRFALYHLIGLGRYFLKHRYLFSAKGLTRRIAKAQHARASGDATPGT
jgi:GT2 family glycosyltransferase